MKQLFIAIAIMAASVLSPTVVSAVECNGYVVRPGDYLSRIAKREGGTVAEWVAVNALADPNVIHVGQCLSRPGYIGPPVPVAVGTLKGLAMVDTGHMEDLAKLNASFYYVWGWCDAANCIPMVRSWQLPPSCPAMLLVGNEPNAIEPYGAPMSPKNAAAATLAIERQCPQTKLIAGNVSADDWSSVGGWGSGKNWLQQFALEYRRLTGHAFGGAAGVHCYTTSSTAWCVNRLNSIRGVWPGAWALTEFNVLNGDAAQMTAWMKYIRGAGFTHVSLYTNRQFGQGYDLPGASVVNADGTLTPIGAVYAAGW